MTAYILFTILGFISGSILYSYLIARYLGGVDILSNSEDGNPGATNVFRYTKVTYGILALVLDIFKGILPVYIAAKYLDIRSMYFTLVLAAPVLGHAFSPFFRLHGGKAIAVSFGSLLGLLPVSYIVLILATFFIIFSYVLILQPNSVRCITVFFLFAVYCARFVELRPIKYGCILIAATVILKHLMSYEHARIHFRLMRWDFPRHRN